MVSNLSAVAEVGGSLKQVQQAFQAYQVARNMFVNSLSVSQAKNDVGIEQLGFGRDGYTHNMSSSGRGEI